MSFPRLISMLLYVKKWNETNKVGPQHNKLYLEYLLGIEPLPHQRSVTEPTKGKGNVTEKLLISFVPSFLPISRKNSSKSFEPKMTLQVWFWLFIGSKNINHVPAWTHHTF